MRESFFQYMPLERNEMKRLIGVYLAIKLGGSQKMY